MKQSNEKTSGRMQADEKKSHAGSTSRTTNSSRRETTSSKSETGRSSHNNNPEGHNQYTKKSESKR